MGKNEKTPVVIDGVEYDFNEMTEEQKTLVNHCLDLDRKVASAAFNLQQLQVGKDAFVNMLKAALQNHPAEAKEVEETVQ